ncbi:MULTISPECIES: GNAT family N-acetyltransferase [Variovorax]|uniref:GNAT family N-acetyltransferase n=1 Tax=Variovorax TaxID=34072 RepID=UPI00286BA49F|nr:GNAT family N-acetyltransferase [Variovorax sp. 3319]
MVGFARAITDGIATGTCPWVVVAESHRRRGIGQALVERLVGSDRTSPGCFGPEEEAPPVLREAWLHRLDDRYGAPAK